MLQTEIEGIHLSIQKAKAVMKMSNQKKNLQNLISGLENTQTILKTQVDKLYASLDMLGEFPELCGFSLIFLQILLLVWDLKMNIHKKAVSSFFEWEQLDRAVGGHHNPLGKSTFCRMDRYLQVSRNKASSSHSEVHH